MQARVQGQSTVYVDEVPNIEDVGRGMVCLSNSCGSFRRIMPFDVFCAYVAAGNAFVREFQERQTAEILPFIALPAHHFIVEMHD